jgi:hypothetical protein
MKAYQVFEGGQDKHGRQYYKLIATYLDQDKAKSHVEKLAEDTPLYGDTLEMKTYEDVIYYNAIGWEIITIAKMEVIDIIE